MCEQQFINEQWPGIKNALVEYMVGHIGRKRDPRYPENGWFKRDYIWPMDEGNPEINSQNELATIKTFAGFSLNMREARKLIIENPKSDSAKRILQNAIYQILDWGGLRKLDSKKENKPCKDRFYDIISTEENPTRCDRAKDELQNNIAFWSKICAALNPGKLFIYDSRVAIALAYFSMQVSDQVRNTCFWVIPSPRTRSATRKDRLKKITNVGGILDLCNNEPRNDIRTTVLSNKELAGELKENQIALIDQIFRFTPFERFESAYNGPTNRDYFVTCYERYHELLKKLAQNATVQTAYNRLDESIRNAYTSAFLKSYHPELRFEDSGEDVQNEIQKMSIMAHIEKMLFMMKEPILALYN